MTQPTLYNFSGLPGSGKSTLARQLANHHRMVWLRIDTIEQALRDVCNVQVISEGYQLAYQLARDNLVNGVDVVADSCNPIQITRDCWHEVAQTSGARCVDIEVICSDVEEHQSRVVSRQVDVPGLHLPDWQAVVNREYDTWKSDRIVIDTAGASELASLDQLLREIENNS